MICFLRSCTSCAEIGATAKSVPLPHCSCLHLKPPIRVAGGGNEKKGRGRVVFADGRISVDFGLISRVDWPASCIDRLCVNAASPGAACRGAPGRALPADVHSMRSLTWRMIALPPLQLAGFGAMLAQRPGSARIERTRRIGQARHAAFLVQKPPMRNTRHACHAAHRHSASFAACTCVCVTSAP